MSCELTPLPPPSPAPTPSLPGVDLVAAFLAGRSPQTLRAYDRDLADFARFLGQPSARSALAVLLAGPHGAANALGLAYRADLIGRGLAAATVARRLAALRSVVKLARTLGQVAWSLEVESPRVESYRDTRGPGADAYRSLLASLAADPSPRGRRDRAMVRLLHDLALRRSEVVGLDLGHVDLPRASVNVLGKGKTARVPITLPDPVRHALADWIQVRGEGPGPLFVRLDGADVGPADLSAGRQLGNRDRLTDNGLYKVVGARGRAAGLSRPLRPHGLRHQGITTALDRTGGDVRSVRKFSRHAKLDTILRYDDNRADLAGDVARLVSDE